ncbi:pentapeptide repeat-containing protein [Micromonospora sp. DT43]|uniref:pentapeptide repeat-containing protein n=1 Tax=Micromonospora sp. DT43 TaxID=3393440 RepID=UPI003CF8E637
MARVGSNGLMPSMQRDQPNTETRHPGGVPAPRRHWKVAGQCPVEPQVLRPSRPASTRVELVPAGPIEVKPDPWQRFVAIGGLVTAVGSILSVLFVAIGLYVTNEANRDTDEANREQQRLTAQGQITDRFTKAIEQLGQPGTEKVDVRLGAIYALERIMRDSAVDQPAVVDILAAFVRVHAATAPSADSVTPSPRPPVEVDIQTALTVLGRRNATHTGSSPARLTPSPAPLDLSDTSLTGAHLREVDLTDADLTRADLYDADLTDADLTRADLTRSDLTDADLTRANLTDADLADADLARAYLTDADLTRADLTRADLTGADLSLADLPNTDLTDADLIRADLPDADLTHADLTGANLTDANLTRADLTDADLTRANLTDADLTDANLTCARTDGDTLLPKGVARPTPC